MPLTLASAPAGEGKQASGRQRSVRGALQELCIWEDKAGHGTVWEQEHLQALALGMKGALHGVCGVLVVQGVLCVVGSGCMG